MIFDLLAFATILVPHLLAALERGKARIDLCRLLLQGGFFRTSIYSHLPID